MRRKCGRIHLRRFLYVISKEEKDMYGIICDGNKQFYVTRIGWICFFILLFLTGCVPDNVKTEAEANKNDHENEFIQIVETELGPDYSLSDVEDYICIRVSDYSLFRDYTASSQLVGTIDHNGNTYDAMYDYDKGILYSDVFKDEIIDSLAETLGMDKSKIIYGCIINHDERDFPTLFPVENRNIEDMLASYNKGQYVEFYLVTSENVYGYDFEDYKKLCESKQKEFDIKNK